MFGKDAEEGVDMKKDVITVKTICDFCSGDMSLMQCTICGKDFCRCHGLDFYVSSLSLSFFMDNNLNSKNNWRSNITQTIFLCLDDLKKIFSKKESIEEKDDDVMNWWLGKEGEIYTRLRNGEVIVSTVRGITEE